jgi:hypothetical protein
MKTERNRAGYVLPDARCRTIALSRRSRQIRNGERESLKRGLLTEASSRIYGHYSDVVVASYVLIGNALEGP